jgi:hypothetical protein
MSPKCNWKFQKVWKQKHEITKLDEITIYSQLLSYNFGVNPEHFVKGYAQISIIYGEKKFCVIRSLKLPKNEGRSFFWVNE